MDELNVVTATPQHINLDQQPENKTVSTRRQESAQRKEEFYKQLEAARQAESAPELVVERKPEVVVEQEYVQESAEPEIENVQSFEQLEDDDEELTGKYIPKKRFEKERQKTKSAEEELKREREARIKFETELQLYNKAIEDMHRQQQQQAPAEVEIDPIDSDAHNLYMKKIRELEAKLERQNNNLSDYEVRQNFERTVNYQAAEMAKAKPDFTDAYMHLLKVESNKARMLGYNEAQAQEYALQQIQPIAWQAYNQGKNVAEVTYNLAKAYGFKPKSGSIQNTQAPDLDKIEQNMKKSHSIINEVKGVSAKLVPDYASLATIEGFDAKLAGKNGRGTDISKFHEALENLRRSANGNYGN